MKNGYKKLTSHGSISIPIAMRRNIGLQGGDPMEVSQENGSIIIRPYTPRCLFCETTEKVAVFHGKGICPDCAAGAVETCKKMEGMKS